MSIGSVIVVGGGTAGWLSAAYLNRVLRSADGKAPIPVTVVESEDIGVIGVGEATVPTLRGILATLGIPEWEFVAETDATLKHAILFRGWTRAAADGGPVPGYFHCFEMPPVLEGFGAGTHWMSLKDRGAPVRPYAEACGVQPALCRAGKSPKLFDSQPFDAPVTYAYHVDAVKLGKLLKRVAMERGVEWVSDTVVEVKRGPSGNIESLLTAAGRTLVADHFVDCTGFHARLIGEALAEPFVDWSAQLLCDRAVACQIPHTDPAGELRPFTTSTAKESGWIWEIDLFTRRGNGYVYSSAHSSEEQAERVLRDHLGDAARDAPVRHLRMQVGHRRRMLVGNCLAIGLAAGFIEPLESTGIYLVEVALSLFVDHIGGGEAAPYLAHRFNEKMNAIYEELRDFIQLHYVITDRDDSPFWRDYVDAVKIEQSLAGKLDLWTFKLPSVTDLDDRLTLFGPANYMAILAGMNRLPPTGSNQSPFISPVASAKALLQVEDLARTALRASPSHREYLQKTRAVGRP